MSRSILQPRWTQQEWMDRGLCHGRTEMFFAPHAERPQARVRREAKARQVCQACPVIFECRRYARLHLEYGFWGGESEEERAAAGFPVPAPVGGRARRAAEQIVADHEPAEHTAAG